MEAIDECMGVDNKCEESCVCSLILYIEKTLKL